MSLEFRNVMLPSKMFQEIESTRKLKCFVILRSPTHIIHWIEERRAETSGHDHPTRRFTDFIKCSF